MEQTIAKAYQDFIWRGELSSLATNLYDTPVILLGGIKERVSKVLQEYRRTSWHTSEKKKAVQDALIASNKRLGSLTPQVQGTIESLFGAAIEAAHQPVAMGGPGYILNKAATAHRVAALSSDDNLHFGAFFFVADYDVVQTELTNIRTPNMGHQGNLISIPVPEGYEFSPVSTLPLPSYDWYSQTEESIRSSYNPIFKVLTGQSRVVVEERLEQALSINRWAFTCSSTLSEWAMRVLGRLFNIEGSLGLPLLPASDSSFRKLFVEAFEYLLSKDKRDHFLAAHNTSTNTIIESGMRPAIGLRDDSYVPFFYECSEASCNRARIELSYEADGGSAKLSGKCPSCGEVVEIETSVNEPSLKEYGEFLSPRVDSRQFAVDTLFPVVTHVGGGGETAYYAQVIPAAKAMGTPFPLFVKYPRVYFNTAWNEDLAGVLKEKGMTTLHRPELFKTTGRIGRFRKKERFDEMNEAIKEFHEMLVGSHGALRIELDSIAEQLKVDTNEDLQFTRLEMERYISWAFGEYAEEKMGQEVSWSWIEWALNSGFSDLFGPYERAYVPEMKNGATLFVNFTI
ncbi:MAG: bacillithiol biosynthesis BshC [Promethearchaeota archaeon]